MIEITNELIEISNAFRKTFGYKIPLAMIPPTITTAQLIATAKECIEQKNDTLFDQLNIKNNSDVLF